MEVVLLQPLLATKFFFLPFLMSFHLLLSTNTAAEEQDEPEQDDDEDEVDESDGDEWTFLT
jgi:hypothetical protein